MKNTTSDISEFVKLIQQLNKQQQAGLLLTLQGLRIMDKNKKR